jgi:ABC-type branched-subunit amino acid transport system ATPase component/ABC-type branched-subunit amino acid transport system permease subunit
VNHINFLFLGLGNGAVFAALALALVVTYRSSGVLNFATGALALYGAYTFAFLRKGILLFLVPGLPRKYHFDHPVAFVPALVVAIGMSALLGVVIYALVFRPIRNTVPVAKAVASLGVMVLLTALISQSAGGEQVLVKSIFPQHAYIFGSLRINGDRMWFAVVIVGLALGLAAFYRYTTFGLATRAAAETEIGGIVSGLRPERIAVLNWAISAGLCGLAGVLIAPLTPLVPGTYTLFIVPALAAAVLGRFSALTPAVIGGIAIGMLQSEAVFVHSTWKWTLSTGNAELIPMVLVLVVLLVKGGPLPTRGSLLVQNLGRSPRPRRVVVPLAIFVPLVVVALYATTGTIRAAVILSMILAVISLSLVVVTGYAGQISLAQLTLAGVGGFLLSTFTTRVGIPFPLAPLIAATGAMVLGVVVGLPALRIRGLLVGVVTLILAVTVEAVWFKNLDFNGGGSGGAPIKTPKLFGMNLGIGSGLDYPRHAFGLMVLVVLVLVALGITLLRTSRLGAAMLAVRANERSAAAAGISVVQVKIVSFAIGAFIAGIGGSLLAYRQGSITLESYSALAGLGVLAITYVAGITSIGGGLLAGVMAEGGILYVAVDRNFHVGQWYGILSGLGVVLTVIGNPEGLVGPAHALLERRRLAKLASTSGDTTAPGEPATVGIALETVSMRERPRIGDVILEVRSLGVRYGGVTAVSELTVSVRAGQIVGLIGPNGAGKTTTIDALSGFTAYTGHVDLDGAALDGLAPHRRVKAGLGRTFQGIDLYEDLTVAENVSVGQHVTGQSVEESDRSLDVILGQLDLSRMRERPVAELSQGERQLVSIARSLATRPRLLLLDEPAAGLDTKESMWLADRLRDIRDTGVTILLVDHDMSLLLSLCDEIHVLDFGRLIASGSPAQIRADHAVAEAYLGASHGEQAEASLGEWANDERPSQIAQATL